MKNWWKILGVLLLIYSFTVGMSQGEAPTRVWLNIDSSYALAAKSIKVISDNHIVADFDMPAYLPGNDQAVSLSLWVNSSAEILAVMRR